MKRAIILSALLLASPAMAQLAARDTADVGNKGDWSVGIFNPLKLGLMDGVELKTQPLAFFVAPNAMVRVAHGELGGMKLAGEYGLSLMTPAMRLTQGYLYPTWNMSENRVGWYLTPRVGIVASRGDVKQAVFTLSADVAAGIRLTRSDLTAMGGIAPLDVLMAPELSGNPKHIVTGYRVHVGGLYDRPLTDSLRMRGYLDGYLHGAQPSPFTISAGVGLDYAVGKQSRVTIGGVWYNADTGDIDLATHQHKRSNDFFPTIDFIWAG